MSGIVDTHCHLDAEQFSDDLPGVMANAADARVRAVVAIGMHPESWAHTARLISDYPNVVRSVGVHPLWVQDVWHNDTLAALRREASSDNVVAIGESGLDFYRSAETAELQREAFEAHLTLGQELDLPIIIHQRNSIDDILKMLQAFAPVRGVMHCFTGDDEQARRCVDLGLHLGIGGILTFPNAGELRNAVTAVPLDRLVLETDAPFLAPQPWRGRRNEPAYIRAVGQKLADCIGESFEHVVEATTSTATQLFGERLEAALSSTSGGASE